MIFDLSKDTEEMSLEDLLSDILQGIDYWGDIEMDRQLKDRIR